MKTDLTRLLDEILVWPARDQAELADYLQKIRARRAQPYAISEVGTRSAPARLPRRATSDRQLETFWQRRGG